MITKNNFLTIKEASEWATKHTHKVVTTSNISYLIQYGRIKKIGENGSTQISLQDLIDYYKSYNKQRETSWKNQLGNDLNWALSFDQYKECETTKYVHRLHPYKGKFIPQLVEYFLDSHTDDFKKDVFFSKGDIVLDPFCGIGTTMVQANELGMPAIGIDVSAFNALIGNCKVGKYDLKLLRQETDRITEQLEDFLADKRTTEFEIKLLEDIYIFNNKYFPFPDFKYKVRQGTIDDRVYGEEKEKMFLPVFKKLVEEYKVSLGQNKSDKNFLDKWYLQTVREEIDFVFEKIKDLPTKKIISVILSRTIRSCRATTHSDLATLIDPIMSPYYCKKQGKICKPLFSIEKWWKSYTKDTIKRLSQFENLRTDTCQYCLTGDSRIINIFLELKRINPDFERIAKAQSIKGIFSSPPYVGLIDYHEQHAYAYDLFGFKRKDELEIDPLYKGSGKIAKNNYVEGIAGVLNNCKRFLVKDFDVFLVANDRDNLYPKIAEKARMEIVNQFKRPVLNRTEKDKGTYSETIFHLKNKDGTNSDEKKEKISTAVIKTLVTRFESSPEDASSNRKAPFHEAFLNAFSDKLSSKVSDIPFFIFFISLSSWLHGLNTTLGQSFFENIAHHLCDGEKRQYTSKKLGKLRISQTQKNNITNIITDLSNTFAIPNLSNENDLIFRNEDPVSVSAIDFSADVFIEDEYLITAIELKSVKPNSSEMRGEKQKILEEKAALYRLFPGKRIRFFIGFPFDPTVDLSKESVTSFDKTRFLGSSINMTKYFAPDETLVAGELWDMLSGSSNTMDDILAIINFVSTTKFLSKFQLLSDNTKRCTTKYKNQLAEWNLFSEIELTNNNDTIVKKIKANGSQTRIYSQAIFDNKGNDNTNRFNKLKPLFR